MTHPAVSPRTEKWIRLSAIATMLLVAISAVVLSFDGLWNLAVENRVPEHLAFLFPIIIDGTITMSSLAILRMNLGGRKATFGWCVMFLGVALSIAGNAISVADAGLIAMLVHALPPLLLAISLELLLSLIRANIKASITEKERAATIPAPTTVNTGEPEVAHKAEQVAPAVASSGLPAVPTENAGDRADAPVEIVGPQLSAAARGRFVEDAEEVPAPEINNRVPETVEQEEPVGVSSNGSHPASFDNDASVQDSTAAPVAAVESSDVATAEPAVQVSEVLDERVESYRRVIAGRDDWPRAKKIVAILIKFPEADKDINNIKRALGDKVNISYREDLAIARAHIEKINRKN